MILEGAQAALALAPIAFAGGFIQGLTGFGSALVTIPLATFFVPLPYALAVFAIVDFANGLRLGLENPRNAVYSLSRRGSPAVVGRKWAFLAGFCGGLSGTLFGAGGPPYAIYLSHRPLSKEQFRATMTLTTIFSIGLRLVAFAVTGLLMQDGVWLTAAAAIPAGLLAVYLASRIFRVISRELVMRAVGILLLASGASLIARGLG